jgi:hypothetical protein
VPPPPCAQVGQVCGGLVSCCDPQQQCIGGRCTYPIF